MPINFFTEKNISAILNTKQLLSHCQSVRFVVI